MQVVKKTLLLSSLSKHLHILGVGVGPEPYTMLGIALSLYTRLIYRHVSCFSLGLSSIPQSCFLVETSDYGQGVIAEDD